MTVTQIKQTWNCTLSVVQVILLFELTALIIKESRSYKTAVLPTTSGIKQAPSDFWNTNLSHEFDQRLRTSN